MRRLVLVWLFISIGWFAAASTACAEKRLALILAAQDYKNLPKLSNTLADADLIAGKLQKAGFDVEVDKDVTRVQLQRNVRQFGHRIEAAGQDVVALVYYAGHGVQDEKQMNYAVGVDADLNSEIDLPIEAMPFADILRTLGAAKPKLLVAIFDACRDNPLPSSPTRGALRGLAPEIDLPPGELIGYSTKPGGVADDGPPGGDSPYAQALAEEIDASGVEVGRAFQLVSRKVLDLTEGRQLPWVESQFLTEDFYFHPGAAPSEAKAPAAPQSPDAELEAGEIEYGHAVETNSQGAYEDWLRKYPRHPRTSIVMTLLRRANEEAAWKRAQAAASTEDKYNKLDFLLTAFPDGVYAQKARDQMREINSPPASSPPPPVLSTSSVAAPAPGLNAPQSLMSSPSPALPPKAAVIEDPSSAQPRAVASLSVRLPAQAPPAVALSPPREPKPAPSAVRRFPNMDAPGNDLGDWIAHVDIDQCESACQSIPGCLGFTYNIGASACFPKSRVAHLTPSSQQAVTGVMTDRAGDPSAGAPATPQAASVQRYVGKDSSGNDLGKWLRHVASEDDCQRDCASEAGCVGYTYNIAASTCIRKSRIVQITATSQAAVTGVLIDREVQRYVGKDSPGADRGKWLANVPSEDECQRACLSDSGCVGYTYNVAASACFPKAWITLAPTTHVAVTGVIIDRWRPLSPADFAGRP